MVCLTMVLGCSCSPSMTEGVSEGDPATQVESAESPESPESPELPEEDAPPSIIAIDANGKTNAQLGETLATAIQSAPANSTIVFYWHAPERDGHHRDVNVEVDGGWVVDKEIAIAAPKVVTVNGMQWNGVHLSLSFGDSIPDPTRPAIEVTEAGALTLDHVNVNFASSGVAIKNQGRLELLDLAMSFAVTDRTEPAIDNLQGQIALGRASVAPTGTDLKRVHNHNGFLAEDRRDVAIYSQGGEIEGEGSQIVHGLTLSPQPIDDSAVLWTQLRGVFSMDLGTDGNVDRIRLHGTRVVRSSKDEPCTPQTQGKDVVSLRQAICNARSGDIITFDLPAGGKRITLPDVGKPIYIAKDVVILGNHHTISRSPAPGAYGTLFKIDSRAHVQLMALDIEGGTTHEDGGSILNQGRLSIFSSNLTSGRAGKRGGCIYNAKGAKLQLTRTHFKQCRAERGGGVFNDGLLVMDEPPQKPKTEPPFALDTSFLLGDHQWTISKNFPQWHRIFHASRRGVFRNRWIPARPAYGPLGER